MGLSREQMLVEMGITPLWVLREPLAATKTADAAADPVAAAEEAGKPADTQEAHPLRGREIPSAALAPDAAQAHPVASGRSSWLVLGVSGMASKRGTGAVWAVAGYTLAELFQFVFIGRPLRAAAGRHDSLTLLDYFESRFDDRRHYIRATGAVTTIVWKQGFSAPTGIYELLVAFPAAAAAIIAVSLATPSAVTAVPAAGPRDRT